MIRLQEVVYSYDGGTTALSEASVELRPSQVTAIVGPNGSGKSTLAKLMMGLLLPSKGHVEVDGHDTRRTPPAVIRSLVSLAWQNPDNQLVCGVVEDDVAFGPENLGLKVHEINRRVNEVLERLDLTTLRTASVHSLTSAQKQLVAVAGAMAIEPRYLILDEVTARLDPASAHSLLDSTVNWSRDHDAGVVMITHQLSEVLRADQVCRLETSPDGPGRIAAHSSPDEILRDAKFSEDVSLETPLYDMSFHLEELGVRLGQTPETVDDLADLLCR